MRKQQKKNSFTVYSVFIFTVFSAFFPCLLSFWQKKAVKTVKMKTEQTGNKNQSEYVTLQVQTYVFATFGLDGYCQESAYFNCFYLLWQLYLITEFLLM